VLRTGFGALIVGALAALLPLRRVVRVDPATAFRRP
jgi:ABC-type antimicrobial peptide transport system permease subunit